jgi:hypothetical protein
MTDQVTQHLRNAKRQSPVELALLLGDLLGRPIDQFGMTVFFKRAFPAVPLGILIQAQQWQRFSNGKMTDDEFNLLLGPYLSTTDSER